MASTPAPEKLSDRPAKLIALANLDLDARNPRFGGLSSDDASQTEILDHIVENFGVGDVMSSLAVNGYFRAEPLVGRRIPDTDRYVVVEGNRRLAACLILTGDARGANQKGVGEAPRTIWNSHGKPSVDPVPVICFEQDEDTKELLSYLGVRHISASAPWDSYAKAAWVSDVVAASALSVAEVAQMVGDKHKTVSRLLEGFYFVQQVEARNQFRPADSVRSGRGSVTSYPFSWIYTILGYQSTRGFLGLPDGEPRPNPVPEERLPQAGLLCRAMFGDRSKGLSSAVGDSRELGDLASILASPEKVALLEQGKSIAEIVRVTRPLDERLRRGFSEIRLLQGEILSGLSETSVPEEVAQRHLPAASASRRSAQSIEKALSDVTLPSDD